LELRMVEMKMELELERQRKVDLPLEWRVVMARVIAGCCFFFIHWSVEEERKEGGMKE